MPFRGFRKRRETQENITQDTSADERISDGNNDIETCAKHPQKSLDVFCLEYEKIYCTVCIATGVHKKRHHTLEYIFDAADGFEKSKKFKDYNDDILDLRKKLEQSMYKIEENIKLSEQMKQDAEHIIKQEKEEMIHLIETHFQDIIQQNDNKKNNAVSRLNKLARQNATLTQEVAQTEKEINEKKGKRNLCPLFIAVLKSKPRIERIEEDIRKLCNRNYVTRYVFEAGEQTLTFMKNKEDFGDLVEESLDSFDTNSSYDTDESQANFSIQRSQKGRVKRTNSIRSLPSSFERYREYPEPSTTLHKQLLRQKSLPSLPASPGPTSLLDREANLQPPPKEEFQRTYSMRCLPSSSRPLQDFTANLQPPPKEEFQRTYSMRCLPSSSRPLRHYIEPPKPGPKPSAQAIKQARERSKLLYGLEQQNLNQQTQNMQEKYKVLYSFTPENLMKVI